MRMCFSAEAPQRLDTGQCPINFFSGAFFYLAFLYYFYFTLKNSHYDKRIRDFKKGIRKSKR